MLNKKYNNIWIVGDIHGMYSDLIEVFDKSNFDYKNDLLISLGDLCDRGSKTWEVIEELLKIKNFILIEGNHDQWFKENFNNPWPNIDWMRNGGDKTINSYKKNNYINFDNHKKLLNLSLSYYVIDKTCIVHGGFDRYYTIYS